MFNLKRFVSLQSKTTNMVKVNEYNQLKSMYPYVEAHCNMMGSFMYYTIEQMCKAKNENAPKNATYYSETEKRWMTLNDVKNENTLLQLNSYVEGNN